MEFPEWQGVSGRIFVIFLAVRILWVQSGLRSRNNRRATPHGKQPAGKSVPEMNKERKVNSRNIIRVSALVFACLLGIAAVRAQGTAPAAGSAAPTKVGVINVRQAIVATAEGKQASAELQTQFASRQNELEALNKQVNDVRQQLAANQTTWSDEQKQRATVQGQRLAQQLERKNNELQEDVNAAQGEVIDKIGRKMMDVLDRYARENGYTAVLDSSSQNSPILYASSNIDITQDIIRLYDQSYPVKAGAAAPAAKPAAAKPAPATTPKPVTPAPGTKP
jgi:outer membrane protein